MQRRWNNIPGEERVLSCNPEWDIVLIHCVKLQQRQKKTIEISPIQALGLKDYLSSDSLGHIKCVFVCVCLCVCERERETVTHECGYVLLSMEAVMYAYTPT